MFVTLEDLQYMIILLECRLTCFQQIICKLQNSACRVLFGQLALSCKFYLDFARTFSS